MDIKLIIAAGVMLAGVCACGQAGRTEEKNMNELNLTQEWDKTFPKSDKVEHRKVTFHNRFGITLAADMYVPKDAVENVGSGKAVDGELELCNGEGKMVDVALKLRDDVAKLPAIAVSGPFGAVKEQASGLYAQELAERGFLTIAFDPSFTGESGGEPRYVASPDINTEDFSAAVDFLVTNELVDPERVGIVGICGWGGFAVNAAAIDTRIKATVAVTMYDMSRVSANGYFDSMNEDDRYQMRKSLNEQRTADYLAGSYAHGVVNPKPADTAPQFQKDYYDYYKTTRGYHKRSLNSNDGWNLTSSLSFMNAPLLAYASEIRSAVMLVHGENAHSRYFSETVYPQLKGDNKELVIVPGAVHCDLYDNREKIPFDTIEAFLKKYTAAAE